MNNAYTYVSVDSDVMLDMLLLNLDFLNRMFVDDTNDSTSVNDDIAKGSKIEYIGISGY